MLEQPKAGLISRFYRQVENRLKNSNCRKKGGIHNISSRVFQKNDYWDNTYCLLFRPFLQGGQRKIHYADL